MNNKIYKSTEELTPFIMEMISKGKSVKLTVTGNSMFPLFCHEREIVEIRKCPVYRKYDIITVSRPTEKSDNIKKGVYYYGKFRDYC